MHPEAWSRLEAKIRPPLLRARRVLDGGGYDVNGSPRPLRGAFDVTLGAEVFEHVEYRRAILCKIVECTE